jgi:hypothetical protein
LCSALVRADLWARPRAGHRLPDEEGCGSCSTRRARHRALGKLDPGPDVHVDDDGDDLEHLLWAEVLGERVVEALKRHVPIGVGDAGERLGIAERRLLGLGMKLALPPRGQSVDLGPRDARFARRLVVQVGQ